jgi:ribonucleoside-diphosphate reductase beta chain
MANTVFNINQTDLTKQPMFFGDKQNIARYDLEKYSVFSKATKTMKSFFWNPEEINLQKDAADFKALYPHEKHIFIKNIAYQTLLDSVQERAPLMAFLPWVSLPELEATIIWWSAFEQIHAQSYQWILQNIFPDPAAVFDTIMLDENIMSRADAIIRYYDDFIQYSEQYRVLGEGEHQIKRQIIDENGVSYKEETIKLELFELKRKLYLAMFSVFALEAIRFYVSFACSFAFGQQGKMKGNADIIRLIAKDEAQHMGISVNILRNLTKREGDDFAKIAEQEQEHVLQIFDTVVEQEKQWAKYLFKDGSILGLNEALLVQFLEYIANKRLKALGFKQRYECTTNPFKWISAWLSAEDSQSAPQEKEVTDYLINVLDTNVNEQNLLDF